jgi:hypothetical protein
MKTIALLIILSLPLSAEMRTWTDAATKRTLVAKLVSKSADGKTVKVSTETAQTRTLTVANLIPEDVEYIAKWVALPLGFDPLKCTYAGSPGKGRKTVSIRAMTHDKPCVVSFYESASDTIPAKTEIPAHSDRTWQVEGYNDYICKIHDMDGNELDCETATSKTGT